MDYAPIEAFLVGRCGKGIKAAALTSIEEFELLSEAETRRTQEAWERMRWEVFMEWAISPNLKRRPKMPQDVMRFPWEKESASEVVNVEPITEAEIAGLCEIFKIKREDISNG